MGCEDVPGFQVPTDLPEVDPSGPGGGGPHAPTHRFDGSDPLSAPDVGAIPSEAIGVPAGSVNRGRWDAGTTYVAGDLVHDGTNATLAGIWVAVTPSVGVAPDDPAWTEITDPTALAVVLGAGAEGGVAGTAVGVLSSAAGEASIAVGVAASATGVNSIAVGASATGEASIAVGVAASATGVNSIAVGRSADAAGDASIAVGRSADAAGDFSTAVGWSASAPGDGDVNLARIITGHIDTGTFAPDGLVLAPGFADLPETTDTTNPAANRWRLVARTDGLHVRDDTGTEIGPLTDLATVDDQLMERASSGPSGTATGWWPALDNWWTKLGAASPSSPVDVVVICDSILTLGANTSDPSAAQLLHRSLNGIRGAGIGVDRTASSWPCPVAAQTGQQVPAVDATAGTVEASSTGGVGSRLTTGQVLSHTTTCTGVSILYRTDPSFGTLTIRDGAGGPVLGTVNCAAAAKSGHLWTSGTLSSGSHTIHVTSTGTTVVEAVMPLSRTSVRVWGAGKPGMKSSDVTGTPTLGLDLVSERAAAGTLGLVVIATGTNDTTYSADVPALIAAVQSAAPGVDVAVWFPYYSDAFKDAEYDSARASLFGLGVPVIDGAATVDRLMLWYDNIHPGPGGKRQIADHLAGVLGGDPIGGAFRAGLNRDAGGGTTSTIVNESSVTLSNDTAVSRTAAATVSVGSPLSVLFGAPDGTVRFKTEVLQEHTSDPASPGADKATVFAKNDSGRSRLYVRDDVGVRGVAFTGEGGGSAPLSPDNLTDWEAVYGAVTAGYEFDGSGTTIPSGWSWVNQGGSTYREGLGAGVLVSPANTGNQVRGLVIPTPTAPFTVEMHLEMPVTVSDWIEFGPIAYDSGSTKIMSWFQNRAQFHRAWWDNPTTWSSSEYVAVWSWMPYRRLTVNSWSDVDYAVSPDGVAWHTILEGSNVSTWLTPTHIGFGANATNNRPRELACHWLRVT